MFGVLIEKGPLDWQIFQQQEEAYQAFLHHCLGGTQP